MVRAATPPLVVYLCGAEKWTHGVELLAPAEAATGPGGAAASLRVTARSTGEVQEALLDTPHGAPPRDGAAAAGSDDAADAAAALRALDAPPPVQEQVLDDGDVAALRRRLLATGPWPMQGVGEVFLLRGSLAYRTDGRRQLGAWKARALTAADGAAAAAAAAAGVELEGALEVSFDRSHLLFAACWRLYRLEGAELRPAADFAWKRPASRCFPTCSERTHPSWLKAPWRPCLTAQPHLPVRCLLGPRPRLSTPERRLSISGACARLSGLPQAAPKARG